MNVRFVDFKQEHLSLFGLVDHATLTMQQISLIFVCHVGQLVLVQNWCSFRNEDTRDTLCHLLVLGSVTSIYKFLLSKLNRIVEANHLSSNYITWTPIHLRLEQVNL